MGLFTGASILSLVEIVFWIYKVPELVSRLHKIIAAFLHIKFCFREYANHLGVKGPKVVMKRSRV